MNEYRAVRRAEVIYLLGEGHLVPFKLALVM